MANITNNTIPLSIKLIKISSKLLFIPFKFDTHAKVFKVQSRKCRIYWLVTTLGVCASSVVYLFYRLFAFLAHGLLDETTGQQLSLKRKSSYFFNQFILTLVTTLGFIFHISFFIYSREVCNLLNQLETYRRQLAEKEILKRPDFRLLKIVIIFLTIRYTGLGVRGILNPGLHQYWYSIVPKEYQSPLMRRLFMVYHIQWTLCSVFGHMCYCVALLLYLDTMNLTMKYRSKNLSNNKVNGFAYRKLQLLNCVYNSSFKTLVYPVMTAAIVVLGVVGWFGSIKFLGKIGPREYALYAAPAWASIYFTFKIYNSAALQHELSLAEQRRLMWNCSLPENIIYKKELLCIMRSCPPLSVKIMSFFLIKKTTALNMVSLIISSTVTLLINV